MPPRRIQASGAGGTSKKGNVDEVKELLKAKREAEEAAKERREKFEQQSAGKGKDGKGLINVDYDLTKWSGKTPTTLLNEMCQRSKWNRPGFQLSERHGGVVCRVTISRSATPALPAASVTYGDPSRVYANEAVARHSVAVLALHALAFDKPLHRLLPPGYRDYWQNLEEKRPPALTQPPDPFAAPAPRPEPVRAPEKLTETLPIINMSDRSRRLVEEAVLAFQDYCARDRPPPGEQDAEDAESTDTAALTSQQEALAATAVARGFLPAHAQEAARQATTFQSVLDWLLLRVPEADLPAEFRVSSGAIEAMHHTTESLGLHYKAKRLAEFGFDVRAAQAALAAVEGDVMIALRNMLAAQADGEAAEMCASWAPVDDASAGAAAVAEELEMLGAIYTDGFESEQTSEGLVIRFTITPTKASGPVSLHVFVPEGCGYPRVAPLPVLVAPSLPSSLKLSVAAALYRAARDAAGEPVLYTLASTVDETLTVAMTAPASSAPASKVPLSRGPALSDSILCEDSSQDKQRKQAPRARQRKGRSAAKIAEENRRLAEQLKKLADHPLTAVRAKLPAAAYREKIVAAIAENQVVVVCGETGCGKTTQVPQFILDAAAARGEGGACTIVCTQPRRLAAIAVAERIAAERGESVGRTCGYAIRLDAQRTEETRMLFCTTGLLLRWLQDDANLSEYTHVIVDEVHERTVDGDYALALLRDLVLARPSLRLVLMSATLDSARFSQYFKGAPVVEIPGFTHPVEEVFLEDMLALPELGLPDSIVTHMRNKAGIDDLDERDDREAAPAMTAALEELDVGSSSSSDSENEPAETVAGAASAATAKGPRSSSSAASSVTTSTAAPVGIPMPSAPLGPVAYSIVSAIVGMLCRAPGTSAILVFLPGLAEINRCIRSLENYCAKNVSGPAPVILPLHSTLTPSEQSRVFAKYPGQRKVIVSTNIAETSVTIDDVEYVIDTGRVKEITYDAVSGMAVLAEGWAARASLKQRQGRAGRTRPGKCFKLFTRKHVAAIPAHAQPEILRVPLQRVIVSIKSLTVRPTAEFLRGLLDCPNSEHVGEAIALLQDMGLIDAQDRLTPLGQHVARIPADVSVGKMLVFGAVLGCIEPILTAASFMGLKSPFIAPMAERDAAREKHAQFSCEKSDILSYVRAFSEWLAMRNGSEGAARRWCEANFVSFQTMTEARDLRAQYASILNDLGFSPDAPSANVNASKSAVVKAAICAGLYPNAARIVLPQSVYMKMTNGTIPLPTQARKLKFFLKRGGRVFLHPASLLFDQTKFDNCVAVFKEKVSTSKVFIRDITVVHGLTLLLFGGNLSVDHAAGTITVDRYFRFKAQPRVAVLANELRKGLDTLLQRKIEDGRRDIGASPLVQAMIQLLCVDGDPM